MSAAEATLWLRAPQPGELCALNALLARSKASWGYDAAFMEAISPEITLAAHDLGDHCRVAILRGRIAGLALLAVSPPDAQIEQMFVAPEVHGQGVGRALFVWCARTAHGLGAERLAVISDPNARGFYERLGMTVIGAVPSRVDRQRLLPRLAVALPA